MNVISNTANAHHIGTEITADRGKVSMHPRPYVWTEPRLAILGAKYDVKDDLAERLGIARMMNEMASEVNRAFSAN